MNYAIILAGGSGTRFWPLSRRHEPKQFLNICSSKPMIQETLERIRSLIKKEHTFLASSFIHQKKIKSCLPKLGIPVKNIFFEPSGKNTLPPIGILAARIYAKDKDAVIVVLPADHFVRNKSRFLKTLKQAIKVAKKGFIVSLGIVPLRPETGYGYIKAGAKKENFYLVERFIEKPDILRAKKFIQDKRFYWNAGIFIFEASVILKEIERLAPKQYGVIKKIKNKRSLIKLWPRLNSISIDYAIMEKSARMALVEADIGWMDLGTWEAIHGFSKKDQCGNIFKGNCVNLGSKNTFVWSDNRLLAAVGLKDTIIVNTKDAILVCAKDRAQEVKDLVNLLKRKKIHKYL